MKKRWNIKEQPERRLVDDLARAVGADPVVASLLLQRGIDNARAAHDFFNPDLSRLLDPFLMKDMDQAVCRLVRAIEGGEKILIYGDYDVDGTTAVALVHMVLSRHVAGPDRLGFYIPDRYNEGYGISQAGVEYARAGGYSLVIALDCGIKAVERMQTARSYGIDFIICDHHVAGDVIPDVVACLDPKRPDCPYPDKNLSGCGVGFKLMTGLYLRQGLRVEDLYEFLDLVVVSIASDIVPMMGENRLMAFHGLRRLNSHPHTGLRSIMATAHVPMGQATMGDIVFKIGPRINAAGRMKSGNDAVRLLLATDGTEADAISLAINDSNNERKDLDREITREALDRIIGSQITAAPNNNPNSKPDNNPDSATDGTLRNAPNSKAAGLNDQRCIVIYEPNWSKGVIGIVASRLTEMFCRPTIILTRSQANPAMATGSARSVEGFDLYRAIDACSALLENFGGHTYAAGLTMRIENVEAFKKAFEAYVDEHIDEVVNTPQIEADIILPLANISLDLLCQLERFEPFGPGNPKPLFITRDVFDYSTSKTFGRGHRHLKLDLIDADCRSVKSGVAFGLGHRYADIAQGHRFDVCYSLDRNDFRGRQSVLLSIKDIHTQD